MIFWACELDDFGLFQPRAIINIKAELSALQTDVELSWWMLQFSELKLYRVWHDWESRTELQITGIECVDKIISESVDGVDVGEDTELIDQLAKASCSGDVQLPAEQPTEVLLDERLGLQAETAIQLGGDQFGGDQLCVDELGGNQVGGEQLGRGPSWGGCFPNSKVIQSNLGKHSWATRGEATRTTRRESTRRGTTRRVFFKKSPPS